MTLPVTQSRLREIYRAARVFVTARGGNTIIPFALAIVPILGLTGAAIDFSRGFDAKARLQAAADAAVLVATRNKAESFNTRQELARNAFYGNLEGFGTSETISFDLTAIENGHRVVASKSVEAGMLGLLHVDDFEARAIAESVSGAGRLEVALVLDNTGSMAQEIGDLRVAAADLTEILFAANTDGEDLVKVGVVPYVTTVNVGQNFSMNFMDTNADSAHHGAYFENRRIARIRDCGDVKSDGSGDPPSGGDASDDDGDEDNNVDHKKGKKKGNKWSSAIGVFHELIGVTSANAQGLPEGFTITGDGGCNWLTQPAKVNHFDLFDGIANTVWKGCVEARPEPYDTLDTVPDANEPDTLFVPYFWPDESDRFSGSVPYYNNDYLDDDPELGDWETYGYRWDKYADSEYNRTYSVLKYSGVNGNIDEIASSTSGPNANCPNPIRPLTTIKDDVLSTIDDMRSWSGGGTITPMGLTWGWRLLSPEPPFTEAEPYGTEHLRKVVVLMTDGYNQLVTNNYYGPTRSDYSGYGYVRDGRFPVETISGGKDYIDGRLQVACDNIKAAGIVIYTVLYDIDDEDTRNMYRTCASKPELAFLADNLNELHVAFENIGTSISELRLSK